MTISSPSITSCVPGFGCPIGNGPSFFIISGVTSWGVYVEMSNTVEGMIRVSDLPYDFYEYDENAYSLTGKDSGRRYCIGQPMRVRVIRTNVFEKTIDLEEADE